MYALIKPGFLEKYIYTESALIKTLYKSIFLKRRALKYIIWQR